MEQLLAQVASNGDPSFFRLPDESDYAQIPQDPKNPITKAKVELGKLLYHETGLGLAPMKDVSKESYSCASCHHAQAGFQANMMQGIGEGGVGFGNTGEMRTMNSFYEEAEVDVQPVRTPSALNVAFQDNMLWNGQFGATGVNASTAYAWEEGTPIETNHLGYQGVEIQAIAGLGVHRQMVNEEIVSELHYKPRFDAVFADVPEEDRYTPEYAGLAIAAYERTLLPTQAPFQQWLKGDRGAMTDQEKEGALLFFGKAQCGNCHTGPALNVMDFYAYGMNDLFEQDGCINPTEDDKANLGRGGFTGTEADNYKFKVPQLYNLKSSPFFGHGSSFRSVKAVVEYKNEGVPENPRVPELQLAKDFKPLGLAPEEIEAITAFIEKSLYDPNLERYVPTYIPSGNCFPNNDPVSRKQLGCE